MIFHQLKYYRDQNLRGETFYSLLVTFYSLIVAFYSLLVTFYSLLVTFYSLLVTFYSLLVGTYLLLVATYWALVTFYSYSIPLYSQCSHYIMRQFMKKKIQALMDAFLRSVQIVCYDVDLTVFRLDFQIMSKVVQN